MRIALFTAVGLLAGLSVATLADERPATRPAAVEPAGWSAYGDPIEKQRETVSIEEVLADPEAFAGRELAITGIVTEVCKPRGCWVRLAGDAADADARFKTAFVKFTCTTEGRIVPLEAVGKEAYVLGQVIIEEVDEATARHYAEDAGESPEEIAKIVGPQKTVRVMTPGVMIKEEAA
jgi:hypothetical protein